MRNRSAESTSTHPNWPLGTRKWVRSTHSESECNTICDNRRTDHIQDLRRATSHPFQREEQPLMILHKLEFNLLQVSLRTFAHCLVPLSSEFIHRLSNFTWPNYWCVPSSESFSDTNNAHNNYCDTLRWSELNNCPHLMITCLFCGCCLYEPFHMRYNLLFHMNLLFSFHCCNLLPFWLMLYELCCSLFIHCLWKCHQHATHSRLLEHFDFVLN